NVVNVVPGYSKERSVFLRTREALYPVLGQQDAPSRCARFVVLKSNLPRLYAKAKTVCFQHRSESPTLCQPKTESNGLKYAEWHETLLHPSADLRNLSDLTQYTIDPHDQVEPLMDLLREPPRLSADRLQFAFFQRPELHRQLPVHQNVAKLQG